MAPATEESQSDPSAPGVIPKSELVGNPCSCFIVSHLLFAYLASPPEKVVTHATPSASTHTSVDAEGVAWATTFSGGLAKYANNKWETIKQEQGLPTNSLLGITPGADGSLWLSSVAGAIQYKGGKFTSLTKSTHKLPDDNVRNILFAPDGSMYICTNTGLQVRNLTTNEYTNYGTSNGFISSYVNHVAFDAKGNRWISCWTEGFYLMTKEGVFYKIGATEGFTPTDVYMARFNEKGELYVCTNDGIDYHVDISSLV